MIRVRLLWVSIALAVGIVGGGLQGCTRGEKPASRAEATEAAPTLCDHQVPRDICTRCNPELEQVYKDLGDWCAEHARPESQCLSCNPELTFTAEGTEDWCREHGLPESKCTRCNPKLVETYVAAGDFCREHRFPKSACPVCDPDRPRPAGATAPAFPVPGTKIRLASEQTAKDMGLGTVPAVRGGLSRTLEVSGTLTFVQTRHAQLSARGDGVVHATHVDVGDDVKRGQPLVELGSAVAGTDEAQRIAAQASVDAAQARLERERALVDRGVSARKDVEDAARELARARAELAQAGRYRLSAPFAGKVVALQAVTGRTAGAGEVLVEVADVSVLWAQLEVPEAQAGQVRPGQKVLLFWEGSGASAHEAAIARVAPSVDPVTRTVSARVELPNPDGTLRAGQFVRAQIVLEQAGSTLLVPTEAVQQAEGRQVVFIRQSATVFEPVAVELGARAGDQVEVRGGLEEGAQVVTRGAFLLKTELLKDSIGAGCCDTGGE